jgi:hypothetical protein
MPFVTSHPAIAMSAARATNLKDGLAIERCSSLLESRKKRWADPEAKARHAEKMRQIWAQRRSQID